MGQYSPKSYEPFGGDINVKVDFSNYATNWDIKNIAYVDTSSFSLKTNVASLKTEVDKLDIDKSVPVLVDLSKLNDAVKNYVVKKTENEKLAEKVNSIDTSKFVLKTKYDMDKSGLENKIPDTSGLVKKTDCNIKIAEIEDKTPDVTNLATKTALTTAESKIPDVTNLARKIALTTVENKIPDVTNLPTKTALTTVENKIPDVSSLVKKTDYNTRVAEIDTKVSSLDGKIAENKTKNKSIENESKRTKNFGFVLFVNTFFDGGDGSQAYLIFQPLHSLLKLLLIPNTFLNGNLKDCLMKVLNLLLHLVTVLLH